MKDGLYGAKFNAPGGSGAGVVVKTGNKLLGGDSAFAWSGELKDDGASVSGSLSVLKHDAGMSSVFGPLTNFTLNFSGTSNGDSAKLQATSPQAAGVKMSINLAYLAD